MQFFACDTGILENPPATGDLMLLTTQRLILFRDIDGHNESRVSTLENINSVGLRQNNQSTKPLYQGLSLILLGILTFLLLGTISTGTIVAALLGGAIALLGMLMIFRYMAWKTSGEMIFYCGSSEIVFPFQNKDIGCQAHWFFSTLFDIKDSKIRNDSVTVSGQLLNVQSRRSVNEDMPQNPCEDKLETVTPNLSQDPHLSIESKQDHDLDENSHTQQP